MSKYQPAKKHAPVDDEVVIPAAIRAAAARSEALHKEVYQQQQEGQQPTDEQKAQEEAQRAAQEEAERVAAEAAAAEEENGSADRQPQTPNPQAKTQEEARPADPKNTDNEDWKHRYQSMKGRHDALAQQLSERNSRISDLERLIARLQSEPKQAPQQPASELTFKPLGQEERETFGDDFIDVAQRAALEKVSPEVARLNRQLAELQNQLQSVVGTTQQTTKQTVYQTLDMRVPNWREINRDPDFLAWVNLPDPYSGVTRQQMMREAFEAGDASRVLNFFTGFLNDEAATAPASAQPDKPKNGKVPLEAFAAPGRAKAPAATQQQAPGEKETISRAQIQQFYLNVQKGHYKGNEAEKNRLERMIFEAEQEGRIV